MKILLLLLSIMLNIATINASVVSINTIDVENTCPPAEKKGKLQKKQRRIPPKTNSPRFGTVLMVLGIVFLCVSVTFGVIALALYFAMAASTVAIFIFVGIAAICLLMGLLYLILGLGIKNRNKDWDIDYR